MSIVIRKNGYTITETIIYVALFIMLSFAVMNSLVTIIKLSVEIRSNRDFLDSGYTIMERVTREIRNATSVDTANSVFNTVASPCVLQCVLSLNTTDGSGNARTVKFSIVGNSLKLTDAGVVIGNLNGQNISVTNLTFWQVGTKAVRLSFTIQDTRHSLHPLQSFYDTVVLRGAYQ
jgi:hypothetical protein